MLKTYDLSEKIRGLKFNKKVEISFLSTPTPILMDRDNIISPNRTNYFPISQLTMATNVYERLEREGIPWSVSLHDFKSLKNVEDWDKDLTEYGKIKYGDMILTKYIVGEKIKNIVRRLSHSKIICITSNFTFESGVVLSVIKAFKNKNPDTLIVVGGRDASVRWIFYLNNGADIVGLGDCDKSLPEFFYRLYNGRNLAGIYKDQLLLSTDAKIDMNNLPYLNFEFVKENLHLYNESGGGGFLNSILNRGNIAYYETSRGCFRECEFCLERLSRSSEVHLERYFQDIDWYRKNNINTVMFSDDNLLQRMNKGQKGETELITFFNYLKMNKMVWEFPVGLEIGRLIDTKTKKIREDLFNVMLWNNDSVENFSGLFRLLFPFENSLSISGNDRMKLKKMRDLHDNLNILQAMISKGIPQINVGIMIGFSDETIHNIEEIKRKIKIINQLLINTNSHTSNKIMTHV